VLRAVRVDHAYTNLVLPGVLERLGLVGRDAAFATELASGTIRRQGTYDAILDACIDRPLRNVTAKVLDALRLGCHQLLLMRVPDHAAIHTTVDLVHAQAGPGAAGFANAVLRAVARQSLEQWIEQVAPDPGDSTEDLWEHLTVVHSLPYWMLRELLLAAPADSPTAVLAANNEPPKVTLVVRPGLAQREELPGEPTPYSPYGTILESGDPAQVPAVAEGRAGVQDEGSQLIAHALATAPLEGRDEHWLDLCAGPGGKAALLAGLAIERGARLTAVERHEHRAELERRAVGDSATVLTADGTRPPLAEGSVDRVLVDAPCTGLGALRRRPEARWRRRPDDLLDLVILQRDLLRSALKVVRPGGLVLYATCSPVLAETRQIVSAAVAGGVELLDVRPLLPGVTDADGPVEGSAQLWPHRHGTDAMFMALLRRPD
jgi:16S rRNA (cytosine967-C5)-methyltransferase